MDPSHPAGVTIKMEPGSQGEDGRDIPSTYIEIEVPNIKEECLGYFEENHQADGSINAETVPIKAEPGPREEDVGGIPLTETDKDLPCDKKECLESSGRITKTHDLITDLRPPAEKPLSCTHCKYFGHCKSALEEHLRGHTGEKPYSCTYCSYSCSRKIYLKKHLLTHSGEKPFSCSVCNYLCSRKEHLKSHMLTHSRVKQYSCPHCNYSCSQRGYLTSHMSIHSGDKPFSCSSCNYSCSRKRSLSVHILTHSVEKPFSCPDCNFKCSRKQYLKSHMLSHSKKQL